MSEKLQASGGFCLLLLWFAAVNGWRPLLTVLGAAAIHELGHCLALKLLGAKITAFRLTLFGMELQTNSCAVSYGGELMAVLAGPAANLLAAAILDQWGTEDVSALIGANVALCVFNLLPVRVLDGGRALLLAIDWAFGVAVGEQVLRVVGAVTALAMAAGLAYLMWQTGGSLWLLLPMTGMLAAVWREILGR